MTQAQARATDNREGQRSDLLLRHSQAMKVHDIPTAIAALQQLMALEGEQVDPFADRWVQLGSCPELLTETPPKQNWLLTRWHERRDIGVFPRGKTGLITGTGGSSKTYAVTQLGVAIASGGFWLETFRAQRPGHVLLALAEEDLEEARRRIWRSCNAAGLTAEQRREAALRIDLLPLHGVQVALTRSPAHGVIVATEVAASLRDRLNARGVDWDLVVIEPLSRWAGGGVESDNEAATRFCQVIETITNVRGAPGGLLAHHSSKTSAKDGAADARGVTGIRDGFRWMASMDAVEDEESGERVVRFRNRKSNYSLEFPEMILVRNTEPGIEGTLRLATSDEAQQFQARHSKAGVSDDEYEARVLETVARKRGLTSASQIADVTQGTKGKILVAVKSLRVSGALELTRDGFVVRGSDENKEQTE